MPVRGGHRLADHDGQCYADPIVFGTGASPGRWNSQYHTVLERKESFQSHCRAQQGASKQTYLCRVPISRPRRARSGPNLLLEGVTVFPQQMGSRFDKQAFCGRRKTVRRIMPDFLLPPLQGRLACWRLCSGCIVDLPNCRICMHVLISMHGRRSPTEHASQSLLMRRMRDCK